MPSPTAASLRVIARSSGTQAHGVFAPDDTWSGKMEVQLALIQELCGDG